MYYSFETGASDLVELKNGCRVKALYSFLRAREPLGLGGMMKNWGYLMALILGISGGWLAQQFWLMDKQLSEQDFAVENQAARSGDRLKRLQSDVKNVSKIPAPYASIAGTERSSEDGRQDLFFDPERFDSDLDALRDLANEWRKIGRFNELLDLLYELRLSVTYEDEEHFLELVFTQVSEIEQVLAEAQRWRDLIALYQRLVALHPDHIAYSMRLAHWLIEAGDYTAARDALVIARNDLDFTRLAESLEQRIAERERVADGSLEIPLTKRGKHYVAEVRINDSFPAQLMLDTGASLSVVKASWLQAAGLGNLPTEKLIMTTANGKVEGEKLMIEQLELNGLLLQNVELAVVPLPDFKHDGLLGMNVLGQFQFFIDQQQSVLLLRSK